MSEVAQLLQSSGPEFSASKRMDVTEMGLLVDGMALVERFEYPVDSLERAAEVFARDGAVSLSPNCQLQLPNGEVMTVGELTEEARSKTIESIQANWTGGERPEFIKERHIKEAYNGTKRDLYTISYDMVQDKFEDVLHTQEILLPAIRSVTGDPSVDVSVDVDEGTVINLQLFSPYAPPTERQEHGAHTDRVDVTSVICLDNIGPQGDFVYLKGYNQACEQLGLDPHRSFTTNIQRVLNESPDAVIFRVYPIHPGKLTIIRTDQDVHFITPKSKADVDTGVAEGHVPIQLGDCLLARGIINAAFESQACRDIFEDSVKIEQQAGLEDLRGHAFFDKLYAHLDTLDLEPTYRASIVNSIVTRMSAEQLYIDA